jgi:hypothetical protein
LFFLLCICPFFNKSVIRAEWDLPETEEGRRERVGEGSRVEK